MRASRIGGGLAMGGFWHAGDTGWAFRSAGIVGYGAIFLLLLACSMILTPNAMAQPAFTQPPQRTMVDERHVDLLKRQIRMTSPELSIGPTDGGLRHVRRWDGYRWLHDFTIEFFEDGVDEWGQMNHVTVTFSSQSAGFTNKPGIGWESDKNNGEKLEYLTNGLSGYLYTDKNGTKYQLEYAYGGYGGFGIQSAGAATKISYADGSRITLTYRTDTWWYNGTGFEGLGWAFYVHRLQSVTSSSGYQLKYIYAQNSLLTNSPTQPYWFQLANVTAINNGVDYCNPVADSCTGLTQAWPSVSYHLANSGANVVETVTDPGNRQTIYTYDSSNNRVMTRVRYPGHSNDSIIYGYANHLIQTASVAGNSWTYNWNLTQENGLDIFVTTVTAPGASTPLTLFADGTLSKALRVTDEALKTTYYSYDTSDRLLRTTFPEGNYVEVVYGVRNNITCTMAVAKGVSGTQSCAYPSSTQKLVEQADYDASCADMAKCNKPNWTKDARGYQTDYGYFTDGSGLLKTVTQPAAGGGITARAQTEYSYGVHDVYVKNSGGASVLAGYQVKLLTQTSTCRTQGVTTPGAALPCIGTADEAREEIIFSPASNQLMAARTRRNGTNTVNETSWMTYDKVGNLLTLDGPIAGADDTTYYRWKSDRQPEGVIGPDPDDSGPRQRLAQRFTYDPTGQVSVDAVGTVADASEGAWAAFAEKYRSYAHFDSYGRVDRQTVWSNTEIPSGTDYSVVDFLYDSQGRQYCSIQYMEPAVWGPQATACLPLQTNSAQGPDRVTKTEYDAVGRVKTVTNAIDAAGAGLVVQASTYSANGLLETIKDGENNLTTYVYDGFDRLEKTRYPDSGKGTGSSSQTDFRQLVMDANGNVLEERLRGYHQDQSQVIASTYDALNRMVTTGGATVQSRALSYDFLDQVTAITMSGTNLSFNYDSLGRLLSETQPYGTVSYQHDSAGRRTRLTWPDNSYASYDLDIRGNVRNIYYNATSGTALAAYSYDDMGRRTGVIYANGTSRAYEYDPISRLKGLKLDLDGGSAANDLLIGKVSASGTAIAYNPASQISQITRDKDNFAWVGHVNMARGYTSNGRNQYTQTQSTSPSGGAVTTSFGYDARGNMTGAGAAGYSYNGFDEMTAAPGVTMSYDPTGRLIQQVAGGTTTRFLYDNANIIAEYSGSNTMLRRYIPGPGFDEPVLWDEYQGPGPGQRFLHADESGSIVAVTNSGGNTIAINSYDKFGTPDPFNLGRFQYAGQAWLAEAGLSYNKARFYSPTLGRFLQTDPTGYGDGMNWYNYVGSDPINFADPSGLWLECRMIPGTGSVSASNGTSIIVANKMECIENGLDGSDFIRSITPAVTPLLNKRGDEFQFAYDNGSVNPVKPDMKCPGSEVNGVIKDTFRTSAAAFKGGSPVHTHNPNAEGTDRNPTPGPDDGSAARLTGQAFVATKEGLFIVTRNSGSDYSIGILSTSRKGGDTGSYAKSIKGALTRSLSAWNQFRGFESAAAAAAASKPANTKGGLKCQKLN